MSTQRELKLKWLFLGYLITNTGASFIWPLTTIYMHQYLGETLTTAGIVLFFNSMAQVVGNIIGGRLFDKWREDRTMLIGVILVSTATGLLVPFHGWPAYPIFFGHQWVRQRYRDDRHQRLCYADSKPTGQLCF
nr:MFS transporter [Lacticaseibacillus pantheris]